MYNRNCYEIRPHSDEMALADYELNCSIWFWPVYFVLVWLKRDRNDANIIVIK